MSADNYADAVSRPDLADLMSWPILSPVSLVAVHRLVRIMYQVIDRRVTIRIKRDRTGAETQLTILVWHGIPFVDPLLKPLESDRGIDLFKIRAQNAKFIATQSCNHVSISKSLQKEFRKINQGLVTGLMTELIVDFLKTVEIEH